jgi:DNA repair protein RadC
MGDPRAETGSMEDRGDRELFGVAFPDDAEGMRRFVSGPLPPDDPPRLARWQATLELARRALSAPVDPGTPHHGATDIYERYRYRFACTPVEQFHVLLLDVKHRAIRELRVSVGILDGSLVHPREVFAEAVRERAASVILVHNHPSGDPHPSPEDREVTRRLRKAGSIVGIPVLDHVIIGHRAFYSFREASDW